jgi:hypothetical protein
MAAMAIASFPLTNIFSECGSIKLQAFPTRLLSLMTLSRCLTIPRPSLLPPHSDGDIRTDLSAKSTARAFLRCLPNDMKISLAINLLSNPDQTFRTGNRAEPAPLTALLINFNLAHHLPLENSISILDSYPTNAGISF